MTEHLSTSLHRFHCPARQTASTDSFPEVSRQLPSIYPRAHSTPDFRQISSPFSTLLRSEPQQTLEQTLPGENEECVVCPMSFLLWREPQIQSKSCWLFLNTHTTAVPVGASCWLVIVAHTLHRWMRLLVTFLL